MLAREAYEDVELEEEAPAEEDAQSPFPSLRLQGHQYHLHLHQCPNQQCKHVRRRLQLHPCLRSHLPPASAAPTKVELSLRNLVLRKKKQDEKIELSKVAQTKSPLLRRYQSQCHLAHLQRHSRQIHCAHHQNRHRLSYFNRHTNLRFARKSSSSPPDPSLFSSTFSTMHVLHHVQIDVDSILSSSFYSVAPSRARSTATNTATAAGMDTQTVPITANEHLCPRRLELVHQPRRAHAPRLPLGATRADAFSSKYECSYTTYLAGGWQDLAYAPCASAAAAGGGCATCCSVVFIWSCFWFGVF
jgi:hypothetical protein